jgi:hypothetical protein
VAQPPLTALAGWYALLGGAFLSAYLITLRDKATWQQQYFIALLLLAPLVFAQKMALPVSMSLHPDPLLNRYYNAVLYYPLKLVTMCAAIYVVLHLTRQPKALGLNTRKFSVAPYLLMLLFMVPLIAAAAMLPDFQELYPRMRNIPYLRPPGHFWEKLLYECSYGLDFLSIELYFRGFLVLVFARYAGKQAILPMAAFYCCIHFGKPLGECISSFFGGILLGVVTYHTRSIIGGLIVHLGIAWMMELAGAISSLAH